MSYDVIIAGGGPAGCATALAIRLANPSARVLLAERGLYPRHKVCGEFVSGAGAEALRLFSKGSSCIAKLLQGATAISRARLFVEKHEVEARLPSEALSVSRYELDAALWQACVESGIECRERCTITDIQKQDSFAVQAGDATIIARAIVDASGRWSNLNRGARGIAEKWLGLKAHFAQQDAPQSVDLYFFDGGYCGVQALGTDIVNVCAMVQADCAATLEEVFELHPALKLRRRAWKQLTEQVATSPLNFEKPEPWHGGIFRIGDAAGFIDPFVGDGITLALLSGDLAGTEIASALGANESIGAAGERYAVRYQEEIAPMFRRASWLRRLTRSPRPIRNAAARALDLPGVADYVVAKTRAG